MIKLICLLLIVQSSISDTKKLFSNDLNKSLDCVIFTKQEKAQYPWLRAFNTRSWNTITCEKCDGKFKTRPTRVLIHGWSILGTATFGLSTDFNLIEDAHRKLYDEKFNMVIVKWGALPFFYKDAVEYIRYTASDEVAKYLDKNLGTNETLWKQLKIVGHSLGAHMAGFIGKKVINGKVGTIIGVDPAGPLYNNELESSRLAKNDATYTECIHTNIDCYGIKEPICQVDFYPNFGLDQPGCILDICDHSRAYHLYAESITSEKKFSAKKCFPVGSNWFKNCTGESLFMGGEPGNINKNVKNVSGIFFLETAESYPFSKT